MTPLEYQIQISIEYHVGFHLFANWGLYVTDLVSINIHAFSLYLRKATSSRRTDLSQLLSPAKIRVFSDIIWNTEIGLNGELKSF